MFEEDFIIEVYCLVYEMFKEVVGDIKIRKRGEAPAVIDGEILTMLSVGEYCEGMQRQLSLPVVDDNYLCPFGGERISI